MGRGNCFGIDFALRAVFRLISYIPIHPSTWTMRYYDPFCGNAYHS
jgi:hypothetical protein